MYRILGSDQKEYGPVSLEAVKQWIAERRANARSLARAEGGADWKPLAEFPELSEALAAAARPPTLSTQPAHTGAGAVMPAEHSALAIASLVLGLLGFCSAGLSALVGLILGIVALVRIRQSEGRLGGQSFAIAGICVSGFFLLLLPIVLGLLLPGFAQNVPVLRRPDWPALLLRLQRPAERDGRRKNQSESGPVLRNRWGLEHQWRPQHRALPAATHLRQRLLRRWTCRASQQVGAFWIALGPVTPATPAREQPGRRSG